MASLNLQLKTRIGTMNRTGAPVSDPARAYPVALRRAGGLRSGSLAGTLAVRRASVRSACVHKDGFERSARSHRLLNGEWRKEERVSEQRLLDKTCEG